MTANIAPVNPELIQQNRRKDARIAQLEADNAQKDALLREMRAEKLANYQKRMLRNRIADQNIGYVFYGALIVLALWAVVMGLEWLTWGLMGLC